MISDAYNNTITETRSYNSDNTLAGISYNKSIGNMTYAWVIQRPCSKIL